METTGPLGFVGAATLATPLQFFPLDLVAVATVVVVAGRWRRLAYFAIKRRVRLVTHRQALAKRMKVAAAHDD